MCVCFWKTILCLKKKIAEKLSWRNDVKHKDNILLKRVDYSLLVKNTDFCNIILKSLAKYNVNCDKT